MAAGVANCWSTAGGTTKPPSLWLTLLGCGSSSVTILEKATTSNQINESMERNGCSSKEDDAKQKHKPKNMGNTQAAAPSCLLVRGATGTGSGRTVI